MNLKDYVKQSDIQFKDQLLIPEAKALGNALHPISGSIDFDVALIGVCTDINASQNKGTASAPDLIRKHLYALKGNFNNFYLADLGNIVATKSVKDTYSALSLVVEELIKNRVIPIIMGGSHDITLPLYKGTAASKNHVNLSLIDVCSDYTNEADFHNHNFLADILTSKNLESLSLLAYQNYLTDDVLPEQHLTVPFEKVRLGNVRKLMNDTEVTLRDADLLSLDIGAVRRADAPGCAHGQANGLYAEEICQMARYAGFSDRISAFGLFEVNPLLDQNTQTISLAAQIIWHFLEGLNNRQKDYPVREISSYNNYMVHQPDINQDIRFFNNPANNRWWMEIPGKQPKIISCSMRDYHDARQNKIPDRFMRWQK